MARRNRFLSEKIPFVFSALKDQGIELPPTSRLVRLASVFLDANGRYTASVELVGERREYALESLREFTLFEFVLDPWEFDRDDIARDKLSESALLDAPLPQDDATNPTPGRDTLVELLVATALQRSGAGAELMPVSTLKTADVRTRACGRFYFVEAKRSKSAGSLIRRLGKGVKQINETGCPGAVFIDVTVAFDEGHVAVQPMPSLAFADIAHPQALQALFERFRSRVEAQLEGSRVTTVYLLSHLLVPVDGHYHVHSRVLTYPSRAGTHRSRIVREADARIRRSLDFGWQ